MNLWSPGSAPFPGLFLVSAECPILVGVFDGFSWIRCDGKGSFLNSPSVKAFGEERIAAGETCIVADLGGCTGMDSTFMGTLAGMAARLSTHEGGHLQIADPGERNRRSLEDLGLDFLMEIDPAAADWRGRLDEIRRDLRPSSQLGSQSQIERVKHVLDAHKVLSDTSDKNAREFAGVVNSLEKDLEKREKESDGSSPDSAD